MLFKFEKVSSSLFLFCKFWEEPHMFYECNKTKYFVVNTCTLQWLSFVPNPHTTEWPLWIYRSLDIGSDLENEL